MALSLAQQTCSPARLAHLFLQVDDHWGCRKWHIFNPSGSKPVSVLLTLLASRKARDGLAIPEGMSHASRDVPQAALLLQGH